MNELLIGNGLRNFVVSFVANVGDEKFVFGVRLSLR